MCVVSYADIHSVQYFALSPQFFSLELYQNIFKIILLCNLFIS